MGDYRDLEAWRSARLLSRLVYRATPRLPRSEQFTLGDQMRRASVSVVSNIAEGHGRLTNRLFVQALRVARGSLQELETQLIIAEDLGLLPASELDPLKAAAQRTGRLLFGLIRYKSRGPAEG